MGGVNLGEESQRILDSTGFVGTQIRSCKDESFLLTAPLQQRIRSICELKYIHAYIKKSYINCLKNLEISMSLFMKWLHLMHLNDLILITGNKYGLEEAPKEVLSLISHATQERLKTIVEKLAIVAEHRLDIIKV